MKRWGRSALPIQLLLGWKHLAVSGVGYPGNDRRFVFWLKLLLLCVFVYPSVVDAQSQQAPLTNKDILVMNRSGLSDDVLLEKIHNSPCNFDTSPAVLADLKTAGVSNLVILEMAHCESRRSSPESLAPVGRPCDLNPKVYAVSVVKHPGRRWRYGLRSEKYDDMSDYLETTLVKALEQQGLRSVESLNPGGYCNLLTIELLDITLRRHFSSSEMDVVANLGVTDSTKRVLLNKKYHGESKTVWDSQFWHVIYHAIENMVQEMDADKELTRVLGTGNP